jgi:hypothetical protein
MVFCCFHDTESTGALRFIFQPFPTQKYKSASKYAGGFCAYSQFCIRHCEKCMVEVQKLYLDGLDFCIGLSEVKIIYIFGARFRQKQSKSNKKLGIARVL